jgi:hypothetical protein
MLLIGRLAAAEGSARLITFTPSLASLFCSHSCSLLLPPAEDGGGRPLGGGGSEADPPVPKA